MTIDPTTQSRVDAPSDGGTRSIHPNANAGAAFRAVLERLEEKTRALGEASETLDDPRRLGDAVQSARASVEEAVSLGTDLIEAYRASTQNCQIPTHSDGPEPSANAKQ